MEALEIEGQAHQQPLARSDRFPRNENCRKPRTSVMMPRTGSTVYGRAVLATAVIRAMESDDPECGWAGCS